MHDCGTMKSDWIKWETLYTLRFVPMSFILTARLIQIQVFENSSLFLQNQTRDKSFKPKVILRVIWSLVSMINDVDNNEKYTSVFLRMICSVWDMHAHSLFLDCSVLKLYSMHVNRTQNKKRYSHAWWISIMCIYITWHRKPPVYLHKSIPSVQIEPLQHLDFRITLFWFLSLQVVYLWHCFYHALWFFQQVCY